ncbi:TetR/AcrR family transcriptional regulator [Sphingomonas prati]|uniref:AcrR family transcriptional regulator n=1 Tax=Sphingomonas prati TaxID=1843237 RepID=A0A7W9F1E5_9SPHN|nr:TetR/AcrR family transcriptional regulator [Sphingomonas prati]MBB5727684.1 AcrR family transcriptional regulator [Sphingomonas prati]
MGTADEHTPETGRRERRAEAMVTAAGELFLERGFDAVSLTQIVRRSGGSLSTLYDLFGSKIGLLGAVVDAERFDGIGRLRVILSKDGAPADILFEAACHLMDLMGDPRFVGLIRLVMSEALTSPEFAARVYAGNNAPMMNEFIALFRRWNAEGRTHVPDPELSAHIFNSIFFQAPQLRAVFSDAEAPGQCDKQRTMRHVVAMFLAAAGTARPD